MENKENNDTNEKTINKKRFRFNIIDVLVILVVIGICFAVVYRAKSAKYNAPGTEIGKKEEYCYVTVYLQTVLPEIGEQLEQDRLNGEHLVANNEFTDAEIVSVRSEKAKYVGMNAQGEPVAGVHPIWKDTYIVVKEKVDRSKAIIKVGGQEARVGFAYIMKTQKVEKNGVITAMEFKDE